jgi:hypothetical protein
LACGTAFCLHCFADEQDWEFDSRYSKFLSLPSLLPPTRGFLLVEDWNHWDPLTGTVPGSLVFLSNAHLNALFVSLTLWCRWWTPLGLSICRPWIYKQIGLWNEGEPAWAASMSCQAHWAP